MTEEQNTPAQETQEPSAVSQDQGASTPQAGQDATAAAPQGGQDASELEIDWRRIQDDEEYRKRVNARISKGPEASPAAAPQPEQQPASEKPQPKPDEEFFVWDDGDPIYHGQPRRVKKAELKNLVQQGIHMAETMREIFPVVRLSRSVPELAALAEVAATNPQALAKVNEAIKAALGQPEPAAGGADAGEIDPEDLKVVDRRVAQVLRSYGIEPPPSPEQAAAYTKEINTESVRRHEALYAAEGPENYQAIRGVVDELISEAQRTLPPDQFQSYAAFVANPFSIVPETGTSPYALLWQDAKSILAQRRSKASPEAPAAPASPSGKPKTITFRPPPDSSVRMEPGANRDTTPRGSVPDAYSLSQRDFDKAFEAALMR